jgi:DNA-binding NarL/FixJ family response regulator
MQERDKGRLAEEISWARADRRVALATNSPVVRTFFENLANQPIGSVALHIITLDACVLDEHARYLADAGVAVVHTDPDLLAAQALCATLRAKWLALPILALVSNIRAVTSWYVDALFEGELAGLLDLETTAEEARSVLDTAAGGRVAVSVARDRVHTIALRAALTGRDPGGATALVANLTAREREVYDLLTHGASDKAIGAQLEMSRNTVGNHVRRIETKLGARTRVELGLVIGRRQPSERQ